MYIYKFIMNARIYLKKQVSKKKETTITATKIDIFRSLVSHLCGSVRVAASSPRQRKNRQIARIVLCDVTSNLCNLFLYFPRRRRACFSKQTVQRIIVYCWVLDILSSLFAMQWMNSSIYCVLKRLRKLTGERFLVKSNKKIAFDVQVAPANLDFAVYTLFPITFVAIALFPPSVFPLSGGGC